MKWTVARAREHFSELLRKVPEESQSIFHRDRLVAVMVAPEEYALFRAWQRSKGLAGALRELRQVCAEEDYELEVPPRRDRDVELPD